MKKLNANNTKAVQTAINEDRENNAMLAAMLRINPQSHHDVISDDIKLAHRDLGRDLYAYDIDCIHTQKSVIAGPLCEYDDKYKTLAMIDYKSTAVLRSIGDSVIPQVIMATYHRDRIPFFICLTTKHKTYYMLVPMNKPACEFIKKYNDTDISICEGMPCMTAFEFQDFLFALRNKKPSHADIRHLDSVLPKNEKNTIIGVDIPDADIIDFLKKTM